MSLANPVFPVLRPVLRLPQSEETWQIARFRLPLWLDSDDGPPLRPWCVVGLRPPAEVFVQDLKKEDEPPPAEEVVEAFVETARRAGFLPRRLEVAEDGLVDDLRRYLRHLRHLASLDVEIVRVESLPQLSDALDARVQPFFQDDPGLLAGEGVTLDQIASFAEAAAVFARAEPWRHLGGEDLIHVESPEAGALRFAFILGSAIPERGVLFLPEPQEETATESPEPESPWMIRFMPPWMVPTQDLYIWERYGLALAGEGGHPLATNAGDDTRRPDAGLLDRFEAFLRAIADTTEDEMDSGRWEKAVETWRGPVRLVFSLPNLLQPPELDWDDDLEDLPDEEWLDEVFAIEADEAHDEEDEEDEEDETDEDLFAEAPGEATAPETPEIAARNLVEQAWEARGRRRVALARQALALWPDCADAWSVLAEREPDPERSVSLYSHALEVAERAIDPLLFERHAGDVWEVPEIRPYLRARLGLSDALWSAGRREEAVDHFQELLRLDPKDHGVRNRLVDSLLLLGRDRDAARVLDADPDTQTHSLYSRTLLAFRREGDSPGARNCLTLALARNPFIPEYLLAEDLRAEEVLPVLLQMGDRSEAIAYAMAAQEVWESTPGVLAWLDGRTSTRRTRRPSRKPTRKGAKPGNKLGKKKRTGRR